MIFFTRKDIGCWADGAFGDTHLRQSLAVLLSRLHTRLGDEGHGPLFADLVEELHNPIGPDDGADVLEALETLNGHTEEGLEFRCENGDLLLIEYRDDEPTPQDPIKLELPEGVSFADLEHEITEDVRALANHPAIQALFPPEFLAERVAETKPKTTKD
jgi:hypothetical protein